MCFRVVDLTLPLLIEFDMMMHPVLHVSAHLQRLAMLWAATEHRVGSDGGFLSCEYLFTPANCSFLVSLQLHPS